MTKSPRVYDYLLHAEGCGKGRLEISNQIDSGRQIPHCLDCGATFPPPDGRQRGGGDDRSDPVADYDVAVAAAERRLSGAL